MSYQREGGRDEILTKHRRKKKGKGGGEGKESPLAEVREGRVP